MSAHNMFLWHGHPELQQNPSSVLRSMEKMRNLSVSFPSGVVWFEESYIICENVIVSSLSVKIYTREGCVFSV